MGAPTLQCCQIVPKNCMKLKEFGLVGEGARPSSPHLDLPMLSTSNEISEVRHHMCQHGAHGGSYMHIDHWRLCNSADIYSHDESARNPVLDDVTGIAVLRA